MYPVTCFEIFLLKIIYTFLSIIKYYPAKSYHMTGNICTHTFFIEPMHKYKNVNKSLFIYLFENDVGCLKVIYLKKIYLNESSDRIFQNGC